MHGWLSRAKLRAFDGNKLDKTTKGQGLAYYTRNDRFILENYPKWLETYAENKKSEESCRRALERLLQHRSNSPSKIYNMDETAIHFDMPPSRTGLLKDEKGLI
ncbi:hypothetical protein F443_13173 [Phytophthora nicotianae P1569]|uniref:DDE-1 domain-containing protein n=1 Tax=Phytophthora nicotianae P1569 TaxID=1317065 RepID=V9EQR7_PHYNI|nr:hypothetical protein F443_13173 [Phytophthora nicotianae P1569]